MYLNLGKDYFYCGQEIKFESQEGIVYQFKLPFISQDGFIVLNKQTDTVEWCETIEGIDNELFIISKKVKLLPNFTIYNWWDIFSNKFKITDSGKELDFKILNIEENLQIGEEISEESLEKYLLNRWRIKNVTSSKKIFVDLSSFFTRKDNLKFKSGIQRVTEKISNFLISNITEYEVVPVYANNKYGYFRAIKYESHLKKILISEEYLNPISYKKGDIFFGLNPELQILPMMKNHLKQMNESGVKMVFFLHDILPIRNKYWFEYESYKYFNDWIEEIIKYDGVICNSKYTLSEFKSWLTESEISIKSDFILDYTHLGSDITDSTNKKVEKDTINFIMIGTIEPRKGYIESLDIFNKLLKDHQDIVINIVGNYGWLMNDFKYLINESEFYNKKIFWHENLSDDELQEIISKSDCLISSSYDEGYGLPTIECAQNGLSLIIRDIPIYRELFNENEVIFFTDLEVSIRKWLSLFKNKKHPICERTFKTWKDTSLEIYEILKKLK